MAISARDLFWFAAGLLTALAAGFVLAPLLPSAQSLRARLKVARWPLAAGALLVVLALTLYLWRGSPNQPRSGGAASIAGMNATRPASASASSPGTQVAGSMVAMLTRLQDRLAKQGGSDADWELLAQSYDFLGRKGDAVTARTRHQVATSPPAGGEAAVNAVAPASVQVNAQVKELIGRADSARKSRDYAAAADIYQQLVARGGMTAQTWADYADITASIHGDKLAGAPERYVDAALAIDPQNEKALWLKASAQHESQRYAEAIGSWQQLLKLTPAGSADARIFAANLKEDESLAGNGATSAANAPAASNSSGNAGPVQVSGEVALADTLRSQVPVGLTLFIVAKSLDSPGPPVAVVRTQTGQWPLKFLLDDSLAMLSTRTLSKAGRVSIEARISHAGMAAAQSGDFQSAVATVDPREHKPVRLVIDRVIG
jgi:cytochrome c-type biogenesis protein CcmH/NrfG